jgi:hypothetical protein
MPLIAICLGPFMVILDATVVNGALPAWQAFFVAAAVAALTVDR